VLVLVRFRHSPFTTAAAGCDTETDRYSTPSDAASMDRNVVEQVPLRRPGQGLAVPLLDDGTIVSVASLSQAWRQQLRTSAPRPEPSSLMRETEPPLRSSALY
jgi:hypothetical protein